MNKKILYTNKYQQPMPMQQQPMGQSNMVQFQKYQQTGDNVNQTLEYIPNFPRTGGVEFGPGNFNEQDYQNAITRDSLLLNNYIQNNPIRSYFMGSNQDHASSAGSWSGDIQLNREYLHKLKGFDNQDTRNAAEKLNKYQAPTSPPRQYVQLDQNKYSLYRMPTRMYQDTQYTVSGGDTAINNVDTSMQSDASGQFGGGGGGGFDMGKLSGYANLVNFGANALKDPTTGINRNPNANLQDQNFAVADQNISLLEEDQPISFSDNFAGNIGVDQLGYQDYQNIINGSVPADAGMGGAMMSGAQGAMAGASLGPVGAVAGFAIGTVGSMIGDSKKEDARAEIRASLTAQNEASMNTGAVKQKRANDAELARFLV